MFYCIEIGPDSELPNNVRKQGNNRVYFIINEYWKCEKETWFKRNWEDS